VIVNVERFSALRSEIAQADSDMPEFRSKAQRHAILSIEDREFILSAFPLGAKILSTYFFDNYNLPCPVLVTLELADGTMHKAVFKKSRRSLRHNEPEILRILKRQGFPVPDVLKSLGNADTPTGKLTLMAFLPGVNLQKLSMSSPQNLQQAKMALIEGVSRLNALTAQLEASAGEILPKVKLTDILQAIETKESAWSEHALFRDAVSHLNTGLPNDPLVFSNGDYQPGNFLTDGKTVTAFLDFEEARFEDRLIGFAKYLIYDLDPLNRAGLVRDYLAHVGSTPADFAPRLALGCLKTLQNEIAPTGGDREMATYRDRVFDLLRKSLGSPATIFG
jgi:aminoglycoside phosphotransferase